MPLARSQFHAVASDSMVRNRRSEKKTRSIVEFFEFVLPIWRTNSNTIVDPAGRHIARSQFPGCRAVRSPRERHFQLSFATYPGHNLRGENQKASLVKPGARACAARQ